MNLGEFGIWSHTWATPHVPLPSVAAEMEHLGYQTLWMSGGFQPGLHPVFTELLAATATATIASGIVSVWPNEPAMVAEEVLRMGPRFLLGLGASHSVVVEGTGGSYDKPYSRVETFLDGLDAAQPPLGADRRVLAALGPRMLRLAAERSLGAHPYFVTLDHTASAREILGAGPLLAPEVAVVLGENAKASREAARHYAAMYLTLPNYTNNLLASGWTAEDMQGGGSDRLIDALIPWGSAASVAARLREHLDTGADHVCVQIVRHPAAEAGFPLEDYRDLAASLF